MANLSSFYPNFITYSPESENSNNLIKLFQLSEGSIKIIFLILSTISIILITAVFILKRNFSEFLISFISGGLFGSGLVISGMVKRSKVINFLKFSSEWDPSLLIVLLSAVGINFILFYLIIKVKKTPILAEKMELPTKTVIDWPLLIGSGIFGLGWGLSGLCPGPLLANVLVYIPYTILFLLTLVMGQFAAAFLEQRIKAAPNNYVSFPN